MPEKDHFSRVVVIGTGGSISFVGRDSLDLFEYGDYGEMLEIEELVARIPELSAEAEIITVSFGRFPSEAMSPSDWLGLARLIVRVVKECAPLDGVVVLHGTSTLEEGAYFLNLVVREDLPIVVVGAQRPINGMGTDGPLNIVNAVRVAKSASARGLGVLAVYGNEIHCARDVTKIGTYSVNPFLSPDFGILGYVDPDESVVIYRSPTRLHTLHSAFDVEQITNLPRVDIVCAYAGADETAIRSFCARGVKGIVVSGYSPGSAAAAQEAALDDAQRSGVLVVLSSHVMHGRVLARRSLSDRGIVVADTLSPQKSRILAMLALTVANDSAAIQEYFDNY